VLAGGMQCREFEQRTENHFTYRSEDDGDGYTVDEFADGGAGLRIWCELREKTSCISGWDASREFEQRTGNHFTYRSEDHDDGYTVDGCADISAGDNFPLLLAAGASRTKFTAWWWHQVSKLFLK